MSGNNGFMNDINDLKYWVWISSLVQVSPLIRKKLFDLFGNHPANIWYEKEKNLKKTGLLTNKMLEYITSETIRKQAGETAKRIVCSSIRVIRITDESYPESLKYISDPPLVLYTKGELPCKNPVIAVVGSRRATSYGLNSAELLSYQLSKCGITIASGMARGIDSRAHAGALKAGGKTIAVLGCGIDIVYPIENRKLMNSIIENGAVITEYLPGVQPYPYNFPSRNRIISGISSGVLVVEAGDDSGSLITADCALEQGREVFAVPGNIDHPNSRGTNRLIREGAKIVLGVDDILDELNMAGIVNNKTAGRHFDIKQFKELDRDEIKILRILGTNPEYIDKVALKAGLSPQQAASALLLLEMKGIAEQLPGRMYKLLQKLR